MLIVAPDARKPPTSSSAHSILLPPISAWIPRKCVAKTSRRPNEFPFHTATGLDYDSGDYETALNKAQEIAGYANLREEQKKAREEGRLIGIGVSTYVEICALGPSQAMPAGGWESATVRIEPTGKVTVLTGASPHGQGQETSFAQIAADELGVDINDVTVIHGDTGIVQYGIGTFGSRATAVGGTAVFVAIQKLKEKAHKIATHLLKADASTRFVRRRKVFAAKSRQRQRDRNVRSGRAGRRSTGRRTCRNRKPKASRV